MKRILLILTLAAMMLFAVGCPYIDPTLLGKKCTEHTYTREYVCSSCGESAECTLEIIGRDFSDAILKQARKNAGTMTGDFEIVTLGAEETVANLQHYTMSEAADYSKIVAGLFVKFDVKISDAEGFTIYYNFGLQFSEELTADIGVTYDASEVWVLEVVEGNKTIAFEYSVLDLEDQYE